MRIPRNQALPVSIALRVVDAAEHDVLNQDEASAGSRHHLVAVVTTRGSSATARG